MTNEQTQMGGNQERFRTTRWSLISEIKDLNSSHSRQILNTLFQDYWKPVYCYIRNKGHDNEKAKDMTQEFFCDIVFKKKLFEKAQKSKGKFRSLLLTSLNNFLVSQIRYQTAKKRDQHKEILSIEFLNTVSLPEPVQPLENEASFNYAWITSLLDNALEHVKEHYCSKGKELHWIVFERRFREPLFCSTASPTLTELCQQYGIEDEVKASNMVSSVKRFFQKSLRRHIREYVCTDNDVDEELSELLFFLHKNIQDDE